MRVAGEANCCMVSFLCVQADVIRLLPSCWGGDGGMVLSPDTRVMNLEQWQQGSKPCSSEKPEWGFCLGEEFTARFSVLPVTVPSS